MSGMGRRLAPKAVPYAKADGTTSWRVRVRVGGKQTTETFPTEIAANVFISRMLDPAIGVERAVELRDREDNNSPAYVPTVRQMLERHVEELTGVEDRTRTDYLELAKRSWLPMLGNYRIDEVQKGDVARWVNAAAGTRAPKTIANEHSLLSAVFSFAQSESLIGVNPAKGMKLPRAGEEDVEDPKFLSHAEFDAFFRHIPEQHRPMVVWMFGMGTRFSETTAIQKRDLDLTAGRWAGDVWEPLPQVRIIRAWKARPRRLGAPKSVASRRTVLLPSEVLEAVEDALPKVEDGFLFRTGYGDEIRHSNFFNRVWKPATIKATLCDEHRAELEGRHCRCLAGKPEKCLIHVERDADGARILPKPCGCAGTLSFRPRIHDARHTHASWLIAQGIRLDAIQKRLGHEDYLTTQRLYGHLLPDAAAEASLAASLAFARTALGKAETRALPQSE